MKRCVVTWIHALVIFLGFSATGSCNELADRVEISKRVVALIEEENFQELETIANDYRKSQSRTSSGLWKLSVFYAGVRAAFDVERRDEEYWNSRNQLASRWVAAFPQSATSRLAFAAMLMRRAWSYRGDGYANTVDPYDWKPFFEEVQKARDYLKEFKVIGSTDPYWYEAMAWVAIAQNWSDSRFSGLVDEGLERHPAFYQIYFSAIDFYAPKWGGSAESIEAFARATLDRSRAAEGFGMYARVYWYALQTQFNVWLFSNSQVDWPTMKKGIDDVLKRYPDEWNIQHFAFFSCLAGDKAKTAELIGRMKEAPLLDAWVSTENYEHCMGVAGLDLRAAEH